MAAEARILHKTPARSGVQPNLRDYASDVGAFSWEAARAELDGLPGSRGLNIAHEAVDRHAAGPGGRKVALRCLARRDAAGRSAVRELSFADLRAATNRFANVLCDLGVAKGDRVFAMAPRVPGLYIAALGTLKNGSVFSPLFPAFGPEPIRVRMEIGAARVLVTTASLYARKIAPLRAALPRLEHVLLVDEGNESGEQQSSAPFADSSVHVLAPLLVAASADFEIPPTDPEDPALLHFTSGTTGKPKGALHVHAAVIAHHITGKYALDLHREDIYWCTSDPGWVTGTSYGIIAPLTNGVTMIVDEEDFDAARWYALLQDHDVSVWYTAPTAIRMLMKAGTELARQFRFPKLRFAASVGEPLNPEAVVWGEDAIGMPFHDNWWQTETGGIMIANFASMDIKPGSMGKPVPGVEAAIVRAGAGENIEVVDAANVVGELALKPGWPSMFRAYVGEEERYRKCFRAGWYLTGDLAQRDADGYYTFVGRADDVIKSAGHLIGPFEVESALLEHPAVAEAGVIGKPDPVVKEIVKAFVALRAGFAPSETLRRELVAHARRRLGPAVAPREIEICASLPKTRSGKIMRRLLKARELGLPEGDTSTLERE
ncbi:MAG TPA: acetate--CoA ligase [Gammaproteobacteria bacterium]